MALKKVDLLEQVPSELGSPQKLFVVSTDPLLEWIASPLASAADRLVFAFGKFWVKEMKNRKSRNPATGEEVILLGRRTVMPQLTGALRGKVNQKQ